MNQQIEKPFWGRVDFISKLCECAPRRPPPPRKTPTQELRWKATKPTPVFDTKDEMGTESKVLLEIEVAKGGSNLPNAGIPKLAAITTDTATCFLRTRLNIWHREKSRH